MISRLMDWYGGLTPELGLAVRCTVNMILGGLLALYIRALYKRCGSSPTNRENFANIFPVLTVITVVIIFVVKSSLALSLGLVGALSIVRFRAAIKTPEELVYLFFCIGVGLALGAEHRLLAFVAVLVASVFIVGRRFFNTRTRRHNLLLTITGESERFFEQSGKNIVGLLKEVSQGLTIQRFDIEDGQVQFRVNVQLQGPEDTTALMSELQSKLPMFRVSYVNLNTLL